MIQIATSSMRHCSWIQDTRANNECPVGGNCAQKESAKKKRMGRKAVGGVVVGYNPNKDTRVNAMSCWRNLDRKETTNWRKGSR
jgi:hypothetical protein